MREEQKHVAAYRDQQQQIARTEEDIRRTKEQARRVEKSTLSGPGADVKRRYAKKVAKKAKVRERRLVRNLDEETIEKPTRGWGLYLGDLGRQQVEDDQIILEVSGLTAGYERHDVLKGIDLLIRGQDRVALLGENGSGKSTLLRCLDGSLAYRGTLRVGASVRVGMLSQGAEELPLDQAVLDVFRSRTRMYEGEARTYLHKFLFRGEDAFKSISQLSYGQRAKLALAVLVLSDSNFLVLDEPTSHMDMRALESIEQALAEYAGPLLLVSHDRYFIERLRINRFEVLRNGKLTGVAGVEEYEKELADA